jgi:D-methionine transport system ATP-binding protein
MAIQIRGLSKHFPDSDTLALDSVDLDVPTAAIHGVIGQSGAGKSTLLRCIARMETPDAGEIRVAGSDWTRLNGNELRHARGRMGIVFQQLHLLSSRTVSGNVALSLELSGAPRSAIAARVTELLEWFGIADKAAAYPAQLSGGQRQRVALARALATKPRVLLADEPTSALDPETRSSVLNILREIREQLGITILIITHDLNSAAGICDSLTVLHEGRVIESGSPSQVLLATSNGITRRLFASTDSPPRVTLNPVHHPIFEAIGQP